MRSLRILSVIVATVLVGYSGVSVALHRQLRRRLDEAESRCKLLASRCESLQSKRKELAKQIAERTSPAEAQHCSSSETILRLEETLEFREMELVDLSKAYGSLESEYDALQEKVMQMPGANLPPEALRRFDRVRERLAAGTLSQEERDQRREQFVQKAMAALEERVNKAPNESIRQNLMHIADSVNTISELARHLREESDDDKRREIGLALRDGFRDLQRTVRDERNLELVYVCRQFGVNDPQRVERFVRAVETVNNSPVHHLLQPFRRVF